MYVILRYSTVNPSMAGDVIAACSTRQNATRYIKELQKYNSIFHYEIRLVIDGDAMIERISA